ATKKEITDDDLGFLSLFANQAASAIETAKIYKNLEQINKRLTETRDQLVRHRTLATLGEFSAGIAHELRNPLVSIGGFAKRLQKMLAENTREHKYADIIATEVENLEGILSQILEFVGGTEPDKKTVDITTLIEQVIVLFREDIEKQEIEVETSFEERARYLVVDEIQMRQLFINLIKNAIEAMSEKGGRLTITSTALEEDEGGIGFEISDTGHGIAPEDIERAFEPFFTRKSAGKGLGLSICSRIVEVNHGGRIFIESKKGHGTSILLWFPRSILPK
ncbi:MAG: ATP-binding protein, partial [bacterium]